jgi:hypothetical protein
MRRTHFILYCREHLLVDCACPEMSTWLIFNVIETHVNIESISSLAPSTSRILNSTQLFLFIRILHYRLLIRAVPVSCIIVFFSFAFYYQKLVLPSVIEVTLARFVWLLKLHLISNLSRVTEKHHLSNPSLTAYTYGHKEEKCFVVMQWVRLYSSRKKQASTSFGACLDGKANNIVK